MSYLESKTIKGKKYHYLVKELRIGKRKKKFRTYIGKGDKTKKELNKIAKEKEYVLCDKIDAYLRSKDFFFTLLTKETISKLEDIRKDYKDLIKRLRNKDDFYEWFITKFTYDSNAIEGSTLSETEVGLLLFEDIAPEGKSLREIHEAENHKAAFDYLLEYTKELDLNFILKLHDLLMHNILRENSGVLRKVQVYVRGAKFMPPPALEVRKRLAELLRWYYKNKNKYHPIILASYFHTEFEEIHPFIDGNGRVGRLLLNFILVKSKFPPIDIKNSKKKEYYDALELAHDGNIRAFVKLVVKYLLNIKS